MTKASVLEVATSEGSARLWIHHPVGACLATVALGHGAGGGVDAVDLATLAESLPAAGYRVIVVEQPWRVAGRRVASHPSRLDQAWLECLAEARRQGLIESLLVVGGRSAGARVACRTARHLAADGVVALAFPLVPPWRPETTRAIELQLSSPLLVIQGERDEFGSPRQVEPCVPGQSVVVIPGADHAFRTGRSSVITQAEATELISQACLRWLSSALVATGRESSAGRSR